MIPGLSWDNSLATGSNPPLVQWYAANVHRTHYTVTMPSHAQAGLSSLPAGVAFLTKCAEICRKCSQCCCIVLIVAFTCRMDSRCCLHGCIVLMVAFTCRRCSSSCLCCIVLYVAFTCLCGCIVLRVAFTSTLRKSSHCRMGRLVAKWLGPGWLGMAASLRVRPQVPRSSHPTWKVLVASAPAVVFLASCSTSPSYVASAPVVSVASCSRSPPQVASATAVVFLASCSTSPSYVTSAPAVVFVASCSTSPSVLIVWLHRAQSRLHSSQCPGSCLCCIVLNVALCALCVVASCSPSPSRVASSLKSSVLHRGFWIGEILDRFSYAI